MTGFRLLSEFYPFLIKDEYGYLYREIGFRLLSEFYPFLYIEDCFNNEVRVECFRLLSEFYPFLNKNI